MIEYLGKLVSKHIIKPNLPKSDFLFDFDPTNEVSDFEANSKQFLDDVLHEEPDGILIFESDFDTIFQSHDYTLKEKFFHSHVSDQGNFIYFYIRNKQ